MLLLLFSYQGYAKPVKNPGPPMCGEIKAKKSMVLQSSTSTSSIDSTSPENWTIGIQTSVLLINLKVYIEW